MKKFLIFILGAIAAFVGFFLLTDKTPTADTPPINNEQQGGTNTPITPEDPSDVIGMPTNVIINVSDPAGMQGYSFWDANGMDVQELTIGETYTFNLWIAPNYAASFPTVNGVEVPLPYTFVADVEFNFYAQLDVVSQKVNATVNCANSGVTAVFYDQAYNQVTSFDKGDGNVYAGMGMSASYRLELQYDSSVITIYNVKINGQTAYQMDESGYDLMYMHFNAPENDFVVEITTTADLYQCSYTLNYSYDHFARIDITNLGGSIQPSAIYGGSMYQLNFETHAGFYVTEVYLNNELLQTYEAGGIASGSVQFTAPNADFELRVVTVG